MRSMLYLLGDVILNIFHKLQTEIGHSTEKSAKGENNLINGYTKLFNSCGHTTDFYLGKPFLPRANSSKIYLGKFISGFVLPR